MAGSLALMSSALSQKAPIEAIQIALDKCMTETFPVRLPHILAKLPGTEKADVDAEKRIAWEIVEKFTGKWLRWGDEDRIFARIEQRAPELAPRIVDAVRRSGGWSVFLAMKDSDFPFVQKRFYEEYVAWTEVEAMRITDKARLLEIPQLKQLAAAHKMPEPEPPKPQPMSSTANTRRLTKLINDRKRT